MLAEGAVASEVAEGTTVVVDVLAESGVVGSVEGGEGLHLAIGISQDGIVTDFAAQNGFTTYMNRYGVVFDPDKFAVMANETKTINFTTNGFSWTRYINWAVHDGRLLANPRIGTTVTNWELRHTLENHAAKLIFH